LVKGVRGTLEGTKNQLEMQKDKEKFRKRHLKERTKLIQKGRDARCPKKETRLMSSNGGIPEAKIKRTGRK